MAIEKTEGFRITKTRLYEYLASQILEEHEKSITITSIEDDHKDLSYFLINGTVE